jgi:membrane-associated phospholipid phosphatase
MIILWLQQFSPALDSLFKGLSGLGVEDFLMLLLPLVLWCIDRRNGLRLSLLFLVSTIIGAYAKVIFNQPRPFEMDSRVQALEQPTDRGFPSLHTQNAVVVWGYLASAFKRRWLWVLAAALIVLIPLSRLYLGVHFPTDLLGGYVFGGLLLALAFWWMPLAEGWLVKIGVKWQVGLVVLVAVALLLIFPYHYSDSITAVALFGSGGVGFAIERRWVRFESGGLAWKQAARFLLGMLVLLGLRFGLSAAFNGLQPELTFRFIRYSIIGLWFVLGAPWVFVKFKLAESLKQ